VTKHEKAILGRRLMEAAIDLLSRQPVIRVEDYEDELTSMFNTDARQLAGKMRGKSRSEWLNLIDWTKARLNRAGDLRWFKRGERRYLVYQPIIGRIHGLGLHDANAVGRVLKELELLD
jgi:hypothetical protein